MERVVAVITVLVLIAGGCIMVMLDYAGGYMSPGILFVIKCVFILSVAYITFMLLEKVWPHLTKRV